MVFIEDSVYHSLHPENDMLVYIIKRYQFLFNKLQFHWKLYSMAVVFSVMEIFIHQSNSTIPG